MQFDFDIGDIVHVRSPGIRLGHMGMVTNLFDSQPLLYAVQFSDQCIGYFEARELEKVPQVKGNS
jgi:hypothetical protein